MARFPRPLAVALLFGGAILASACSQSGGHSDAEDLQFLQHNGGDPAALDARFGQDARSACALGADEYLESISSKTYKWDDATSGGSAGGKFGASNGASAGTGLLTLVSNHALIANGTGAFDPVTFYCLYDAMAKQVVRYSQENPAAITNAPPAAQTSGAGIAPPPPVDPVVPPQVLPPLDQPANGADATSAPVAQPPGDTGNAS